MRMLIIGLAAYSVATVANAQSSTTEYQIQSRIFVGNLQSPGTVQVLASPQLRTVAGRAATVELGEAPNGHRFHLEVTPSYLSEGRVALRVVAETGRGERIARTTFDLVSGANMTAPTVALRDSGGSFMTDKEGRPMFLEFSATARR